MFVLNNSLTIIWCNYYQLVLLFGPQRSDAHFAKTTEKTLAPAIFVEIKFSQTFWVLGADVPNFANQLALKDVNSEFESDRCTQTLGREGTAGSTRTHQALRRLTKSWGRWLRPNSRCKKITRRKSLNIKFRCLFKSPSTRNRQSLFSAISMVFLQILVDFQAISIDFRSFSISFSQFQSVLINFDQFRSVWLGQKRRNSQRTLPY